MTTTNSIALKRGKLRDILQRKRLTVMPGGFSPLYAKLAQEAGFECFFLAGSQLSAFLYGLPDNGIVGLRDLVDHARHMAMRCDIPIFVDADTGYGNAVNVYSPFRNACIPASPACRSRTRRRRRNPEPWPAAAAFRSKKPSANTKRPWPHAMKSIRNS